LPIPPPLGYIAEYHAITYDGCGHNLVTSHTDQIWADYIYYSIDLGEEAYYLRLQMKFGVKLMKRFWRFAKWTLAIVTGVVLIAAIILAITGVPNIGNVETKNVPRIGWSNLFATLGAVNPPTFLFVFGFDQDNNLEYDNGTGLVSKIDNATGDIVQTSKMLPFEPYVRRIPGSNDEYLFLQDRATNEQFNLMIYHAVVDSSEVLLSEGYGVYNYDISPDGSMILAYVVDMETNKHTLYRVNLQGDRTPIALCSFEGHLVVEGFDSGLQYAYVLQSDDDKTGRLLRVDLDDGSYEPVFAEEREGVFYHGNEPAWLYPQHRFVLGKNDSLAIYARTGEAESEREFVSLWERNVFTGESKRLSSQKNADVWQLNFSPDERYVVYVMVEKGYPALHVFDRHENLDRVLYDNRENLIAHQWENKVLVHPERNLAYFSTMSLNGMRLMSADLETGALSTVVDGVDTTAGSQIKFSDFEYKTSDSSIGVMTGIHTYMYEPVGSVNEIHPVVIAFHGGPDALFTPMAAPMNPLFSLFISKGYTVLLPNYRGSWGYGTTFERADDGFSRESQIEDVGALLDWIKQQPNLDSEHIVLYGESWGGYFVMESLIRYPDAFKGGISMVGVSDLKSIAQNRFFCGWERGEVGDLSEPGMVEFLDSISPCNNATKITKPLYMNQGGEDPRVLPGPGRKMADAMEQAGQSVWYTEIPYAGHGIGGAAPQDIIYTAASIMEFFDRLDE
jgi:dienelactone hydrolase